MSQEIENVVFFELLEPDDEGLLIGKITFGDTVLKLRRELAEELESPL